MVVDISVQDARDERAHRPTELVGALGMRVGFRDDADRRPPGVAQHDSVDVRRRERRLEELVGAERVAQGRGVVAELADLCCCLVDDHQDVADPTDRTRSEGRIAPALDLGSDARRIQVQAVSGYLQLQARRVAPPDLEPVQRRERLVGAEQNRTPSVADFSGGEVQDLLGGAEPVATDGPDAVPAANERGVHRLDLTRLEGCPHLRTVEHRLDRIGCLAERLGTQPDVGAQRRVVDQG
ncbi:MAG: hypothetical protein V9E94_09985 [Microthrixaceae bacterium]